MRPGLCACVWIGRDGGGGGEAGGEGETGGGGDDGAAAGGGNGGGAVSIRTLCSVDCAAAGKAHNDTATIVTKARRIEAIIFRILDAASAVFWS